MVSNDYHDEVRGLLKSWTWVWNLAGADFVQANEVQSYYRRGSRGYRHLNQNVFGCLTKCSVKSRMISYFQTCGT